MKGLFLRGLFVIKDAMELNLNYDVFVEASSFFSSNTHNSAYKKKNGKLKPKNLFSDFFLKGRVQY